MRLQSDGLPGYCSFCSVDEGGGSEVRAGRFTVTVGDAAHAQLPALGLGVSTAFGDVEELVAQLDRHGLSQKALRWYERCRMPTCAALQLMSRSMYGLNKISANTH